VTETGGFVVLFAWLLFGALLALLAYFLLRGTRDPLSDAKHNSDNPSSVP
jgi:hypothetical protein